MSAVDYTPREVVRDCRTVEVLRVQVTEGASRPDSPVRLVTYWYERDGTLIARVDPWERAGAVRSA